MKQLKKFINFRKKKALPSSPKEDDDGSTAIIPTKKTKLEDEMNRDELLELLKKEREAAAKGFQAFVEADLASQDTAIEIEPDHVSSSSSSSSSSEDKEEKLSQPSKLEQSQLLDTVDEISRIRQTEDMLDNIERLRSDIDQREDNNMNSSNLPPNLQQDDPSISLISSSSKSSTTSTSSSIRTASNALYSTPSFKSDAANLYFNAMRAKNKHNKDNKGEYITWTNSSDDNNNNNNKITNVDDTTKKVNVVDMSFNLATFKRNDKSKGYYEPLHSPLDDFYDNDSDDLSTRFVDPHVVSVATDTQAVTTTISNRSQSDSPQEVVQQTISSDSPQVVSAAESDPQDLISKEENGEREAEDQAVTNNSRNSNVVQKISQRLAMMSKGKNHINYSPLDDIYDLDDDIETTTVQVGNDSNNVVAIPTADSSGKCSSIVESATSKKEEIPQLLDPAPTVSEKKVRMVAPTRDKEKVAKLAKSSRKSPPSSKKFVSSPVLEECYNENNGTSLLERMKNITGPTRMDKTKKDTVEPTKNDATVNHQPSLSSIGIANPKKSSFSWSKADNSPVEMMAKFTSRTKIDDCSLSKEEQTLLKTELLGLAVSKSQGVSEDDVKDNAPTSKDISLDSHEGNGILDHLSITSASRESNEILDHLRMTSADGNSIEKIDNADQVNDLDRLVTQERTRLSNLLEESVEKSNEDEDEKFEVDSKCKVELKRSTENSKELTHKTKVITPCSDNEAEVEMILGGSSLAHGAGQESNASTSSSLKSLEKLLALALASADKPEDVARFLLEHHTQKANSTSMPVSPPTTEVYVSPSKKERSLWSPFNLFSEDQGLESAASSVTHHSYPNNKTSNNEVCSVETEPKNSSDVCNNNTSLKNNYSFISADFNMNEKGSNNGYEIKQKDETDSIKRDNQEKIDALKEVLTNMSSDMKLREELLTWVANTEDDTFSWHSVETDNEDGAFGGDGNVDEEILNEDNANNTLLLNRAKKESIVSKHRSRILSKIRENKAKNKETSFEGDKSSTINTPIFSPTTPDEEVSLLSYKRASVTSLWDDSVSLTVTEESSTGSAESVAACGLGVMQEMTKDLGEVLASIKQMLPGCISRG